MMILMYILFLLLLVCETLNIAMYDKMVFCF